MEAFVTSEQVAELLGVSVATLNYWATRRTGPPYRKIGRHRRYDMVEVRAWADEKLVRTA